MSIFVITVICVGVYHACSNYASHKSVAQAIENGLEWVFVSYLGGIVALVVFILLATHFCWLSSC